MTENRAGIRSLKLAYDLLLESAVPGLSSTLKQNPAAYEVAFRHWLNKTVDDAIAAAKSRGGEKDGQDSTPFAEEHPMEIIGEDIY